MLELCHINKKLIITATLPDLDLDLSDTQRSKIEIDWLADTVICLNQIVNQLRKMRNERLSDID